MTRVVFEKITCALCQQTSKHRIMKSTNAFGSDDLDTRSPDMERGTMDMWVQECPHCGYSAQSLEDKLPCDRAFFETEAFRAPLLPPPGNPLTGRFIKMCRLQAHLGNPYGEFMGWVYVAWTADDAKDAAWQDEARQRALRVVGTIAPDERKNYQHRIRADLLRKTRQFDCLIADYENFSCGDELVDRIIRFEVARAHEQDTRTYTEADLPKAAESTPTNQTGRRRWTRSPRRCR